MLINFNQTNRFLQTGPTCPGFRQNISLKDQKNGVFARNDTAALSPQGKAASRLANLMNQKELIYNLSGNNVSIFRQIVNVKLTALGKIGGNIILTAIVNTGEQNILRRIYIPLINHCEQSIISSTVTGSKSAKASWFVSVFTILQPS